MYHTWRRRRWAVSVMISTMMVLSLLAVSVTLPVEGVEALLLRLGAVSLMGTAIWKAAGKPVQSWFKERAEQQENRLVRIEAQVTTNGARKLLPEHQRDLSLADLVVSHIIDTAADARAAHAAAIDAAAAATAAERAADAAARARDASARDEVEPSPHEAP